MDTLHFEGKIIALHYNDSNILAEISKDLGQPMSGIEISTLKENERMQERGW
jgi:pyridoxal 5'-phosphate synthase pdxS subunit